MNLRPAGTKGPDLSTKCDLCISDPAGLCIFVVDCTDPERQVVPGLLSGKRTGADLLSYVEQIKIRYRYDKAFVGRR